MTSTFHLRLTGRGSFIRGLRGERRECARKTAGEGFAVGTTHQYDVRRRRGLSALHTRLFGFRQGEGEEYDSKEIVMLVATVDSSIFKAKLPRHNW